jgi:hypothetical protein
MAKAKKSGGKGKGGKAKKARADPLSFNFGYNVRGSGRRPRKGSSGS